MRRGGAWNSLSPGKACLSAPLVGGQQVQQDKPEAAHWAQQNGSVVCA